MRSLNLAESAQDVPAVLRIDADGPTVKMALDEFVASMQLRDVTEGYLKDVTDAVREAAQLESWIYPSQITPTSVRDWLAKRKVKGASPKYLNDLRGYVNTFCKFLETQGYIEDNPVDKVGRNRITKKKHRVVPTTEEVARLILSVKDKPRKKDRWLVYLFAASTGLRKGTIDQLDWSHVMLDAKPPRLELPGEIVKNGEETTVWLTEECAKWLMWHREQTGGIGPVFSGIPKPDHFNNDIDQAGIEKWRGSRTLSMHSLRHFASNRMEWTSAFKLDERRKQNGHLTSRMTSKVYTDPGAEELGWKIFAMEPILPADFAPPRGRRNTKVGVDGLDTRKQVGQHMAAKSSTPTSPPHKQHGPTNARFSAARGDFAIFSGLSESRALVGSGFEVGAEPDRHPPDSHRAGGSNPPTPITEVPARGMNPEVRAAIVANLKMLVWLLDDSGASQDGVGFHPSP